MKTAHINGRAINYIRNESFWFAAEHGAWEKESFVVLDKFLKKDSVFVDIGAWNGVLSLYAEQLGAECHAIEPDKIAYAELLENVFVNASSIRVYDTAIAHFNGSTWLRNAFQFGDSMSSLIGTSFDAQSMAVECKTFALFYFTYLQDKKIDLIKMDIEGSEALVIPEMSVFLAMHKPTMYISFHPAWLPKGHEDIHAFIDTLFPIYNVESAKTGEQATVTEFFSLLNNTNWNHSFIFTAK